MSLQLNGTNVSNVLFNGSQVQELQLNGVTVWTAWPTVKESLYLTSGYYSSFADQLDSYGFFKDGSKRYGNLSPYRLYDNGWQIDEIRLTEDRHNIVHYVTVYIGALLSGPTRPDKILLTNSDESVSIELTRRTPNSVYYDSAFIPGLPEATFFLKTNGTIKLCY